jgi:hypothetical protein
MKALIPNINSFRIHDRIHLAQYSLRAFSSKVSINQNKNRSHDEIADNQNRISTQFELTDRIRKNRKLFSDLKCKRQKEQLINKKNHNADNLAIRKIKHDIGQRGVNDLNQKNNKKLLYMNQSTLKLSEKDYLNRSYYNIRYEMLDENAKKLLSELQSINKTSTNPKHLTLVHEVLIKKIVDILYQNMSSKRDFSNIFVDLQPGYGLVTKNLSEKYQKLNKDVNNRNKLNQELVFILIESFSPYFKYLKKIKDDCEKNGITTHFLKGYPFEQSFLVKNNLIKKNLSTAFNNIENPKRNFVFFGIVPWSYKGFLTKLFHDYLSNNGVFSLITEPKNNKQSETFTDFYLYISEWLLAKLLASSNKDYLPFRSSLSVFSDVFGKVEVISEESCEYLYPYPLVSPPNKTNFKYPNNKVRWNKVYLINLKIKENELIINKRLFYLFISNLFVRPNDILKDSQLKSMCKNVDIVCKRLGLNKYEQIRKMESHVFLRLFNYLLENKDGQSNLNNLINERSSIEVLIKQDQYNSKELQNLCTGYTLQEIKFLNKSLTGRFIIPSYESSKASNVFFYDDHSLSAESKNKISEFEDEIEIVDSILNLKLRNKG